MGVVSHYLKHFFNNFCYALIKTSTPTYKIECKVNKLWFGIIHSTNRNFILLQNLKYNIVIHQIQ